MAWDEARDSGTESWPTVMDSETQLPTIQLPTPSPGFWRLEVGQLVVMSVGSYEEAGQFCLAQKMLARGTTGEVAEIPDEMRLIGIAAIDCRLGARPERAGVLEHAQRSPTTAARSPSPTPGART